MLRLLPCPPRTRSLRPCRQAPRRRGLAAGPTGAARPAWPLRRPPWALGRHRLRSLTGTARRTAGLRRGLRGADRAGRCTRRATRSTRGQSLPRRCAPRTRGCARRLRTLGRSAGTGRTEAAERETGCQAPRRRRPLGRIASDLPAPPELFAPQRGRRHLRPVAASDAACEAKATTRGRGLPWARRLAPLMPAPVPHFRDASGRWGQRRGTRTPFATTAASCIRGMSGRVAPGSAPPLADGLPVRAGGAQDHWSCGPKKSSPSQPLISPESKYPPCRIILFTTFDDSGELFA